MAMVPQQTRQGAITISPLIPLMVSTATAVAWRIAPTWRAMSPVASAVCCARFLTSEATTAKPLPAAPARAASIVALSAKRLVWPAMSLDQLHHVADALQRLC